MEQVQSGKGKRRVKTDPSEWQNDNVIEDLNHSDDDKHVISQNTNESTPKIDINNDKDYNQIRQTSRQKYLKDREQKKLKELEQDINEYKAKQSLTKEEEEDFQHKLKIYNIVNQADKLEQEYELPEDYLTQDGKIDKKRKYEALNQRQSYKEPRAKSGRYENQWELDQIRKALAIVKTTSDEITVQDNQEYEYVFDEDQFVQFDEGEELPEDSSAGQNGTNSNKASIEEVRKSLPVYKKRQEFLDLMEKNQIVVIVGETGSGKTTQLPQYLYEAGYCNKDGKKMMIGCTQPRRVAATSVAARVAEEMHVRLGQEVGYSIRFEDETSERTVVKYLTDGTLLREFLSDPLLSNYSALVIDEAHERTISTEILLSLLKDIAHERTDLKIIVASATINAQKFSEFFNGAPIFNVPGRRYPVAIHYTQQPEANYIQAAVNTIFLIHSKKPRGDILVFLTGQEEIESLQESLIEATEKMISLMDELIICPIYANLPYDLQKKIFEPTPPNARKVVLATNIAETSITIDGIQYVIDCGYVKENVYNPSTGMDSLIVVPCSKASADQRAGRAGRVGPGECFRLYTKWSFNNELLANPTPEILRGNLISTVLLLLSLGINDLVNFDFMDSPSSETLIKCLELLYAIGALNSKGELTKTGRKMADFPIDPMFSKALLHSAQYGLVDEISTIIAMLGESSNLFYRPKDKKEEADKKKELFYDVTGDHLTLLNVWNHWKDTQYSSLWCQDNFIQYRSLKRVKEVKDQLTSLCKKAGLFLQSSNATLAEEDNKTEHIQKSIVAGFFPHVVRLSKMGDSYRTLKKNQAVYIHPSSSLYPQKPPPKLLLYHELVLTSKEYMRNCMTIKDIWLQELAPHFYKPSELDAIVQNRSKKSI